MKKALCVLLVLGLLIALVSCDLPDPQDELKDYFDKISGTWYHTDSSYTKNLYIGEEGYTLATVRLSDQETVYNETGDISLTCEKYEDYDNKIQYKYTLTFMPLGRNSYNESVSIETDTRIIIGSDTYTKIR